MSVSITGRSIAARAGVFFAGAALMFAAFSVAASAAPIEKSAFSVAGAFKNECVDVSTGSDCTSTNLNALESDTGKEACFNSSTYHISSDGQFTPTGYRFGCAPVTEGGFTFDAKGLSGATLSETTITLEVYSCDATGCRPAGTDDVVVSGTWTGAGDVSSQKSNSKFSFGNCSGHFHGNGASRSAAASVTVDGDTFAPQGMLMASTSKIRMTCT